MLNLTEKYWDWRKELSLKLEEVQKKKAFREKYKEYFKRADELKHINKPASAELTALFVVGIESGVKSVINESHYTCAEFNNGYKVKFWTANKMYAYAQDAVFTSPNGEKLNFYSYMPEKWCLFYILDKIENKC